MSTKFTGFEDPKSFVIVIIIIMIIIIVVVVVVVFVIIHVLLLKLIYILQTWINLTVQQKNFIINVRKTTETCNVAYCAPWPVWPTFL